MENRRNSTSSQNQKEQDSVFREAYAMLNQFQEQLDALDNFDINDENIEYDVPEGDIVDDDVPISNLEQQYIAIEIINACDLMEEFEFKDKNQEEIKDNLQELYNLFNNKIESTVFPTLNGLYLNLEKNPRYKQENAEEYSILRHIIEINVLSEIISNLYKTLENKDIGTFRTLNGQKYHEEVDKFDSQNWNGSEYEKFLSNLGYKEPEQNIVISNNLNHSKNSTPGNN